MIQHSRTHMASARLWGLVITAVCAITQIIISDSASNITISVIAAVTGGIAIYYCARDSTIAAGLISTVMIIGLVFSTTWGALVIQTLSGRELDYNLDSPIESFLVSSAVTVVAIITHIIYRSSSMAHSFRRSFSDVVLRRFSVFAVPTHSQLWVMGFIGLAATFYTINLDAGGELNYGDIAGKGMAALVPFSVAPFLIPLSNALFYGKPMKVVDGVMLVGYFGLLLIAAAARNSRGYFATIFVIIGLGLIIALILGRIRLGKAQILIGACVVLLGIFLAPIISDLATAMVIVRGLRSNSSPTELVVATFDTFGDKGALEARRAYDSIIDGSYSENYMKNLFFQRFILTKYVDLNISHIANLSPEDQSYAREVFVNRLIAQLPTPVLRIFSVEVNKSDLQYSGGDLYLFLSGGADLGGFTTGSSAADGLVLFGQFYWIVMAGVYLGYFFLFDALAVSHKSSGIALSPVVVMQLPFLFSFSLMTDNFANYIGDLTRGFLQTILLYWLVYSITRFVRGVSNPEM